MRPSRYLVLLVLLGLSSGLALGTLGTLARAQEDPPPVAPGPEERVLFAPNLGLLRRPMPGAKELSTVE